MRSFAVMPDDLVVPQVPRARPDDAEDVSWALSTADAMWTRGDHADAIRWVRRAAEAAGEAEADVRALELAKAAAELAAAIVHASSPALAEEPEAELASTDLVPVDAWPSAAPPTPAVIVAPTGEPTFPPAPPTPMLTGLPSTGGAAATPVPSATAAADTSTPPRRTSTLPPPTMRADVPARRPGAKPPLGPRPPAPGAATAPPARPAGALEPTPLAPRVFGRPADGPPRQPPAVTGLEPDVDQALGLGAQRPPTAPETDPELDLSRTQTGRSSAALLAGLHAPKPLATSQAVRVVLWHDAAGVHVAPAGTVVSAITIDAMLVALSPDADLASWLAPRRTLK